MMAPHHESALAMAQVALVRAQHPELTSLAWDIITSQSAEIDQMTLWRMQWYPGVPIRPMDQDMMMQMMPGMPATPGAMPDMGSMGMMMNTGQEVAQLCTTGEPFDLAFIDAMVRHHQSAIMMAQVAGQRAQHPEVKALAQAIIAAQQREIDEMTGWRAAWFGTTPMASPTS